MNKLILPLCFLVFIGCKKDKDDNSSTTTTPAAVVFNKANLIGTWEINKDETYKLANDSLIDTDVFDKGYLSVTFHADNSIIATEDGDSENIGNYTIVKKGNKDILVFIGLGDNDSNEVMSFSATSMVWSSKIDAIAWGDNIYSKSYLTKR